MKKRPHCFITGATRGLGRELAFHFWDAGCNLTLLGRSRDSLDEMECLLPPCTDQKVVSVLADLSLDHDIIPAVETSQKHNGDIDVLINNAAIHGAIGALESTSEKEWKQAIQVDLLSPVALCRLVLPGMRGKKWGRIINLSGGGASGARPNFSVYATAKTGLVRFSECLAHELSGTGITVNCVAPGIMKTHLLEEIVAKGESNAGAREMTVAQKVLAQDDSAMDKAVELCLFLASSASDGITGKLISAVWDDYRDWPNHLQELRESDLYTLRRITGRDRGKDWGDK